MINLDSIFGVIAPQQCIACGVEGSVLCDQCLLSAGDPIPSRCAGCKKLTKEYRTCKSCRSWLSINSVFVANSYEGIYEKLLISLKFDHKRQAATPMAKMMCDVLPDFRGVVVVPLPTASARIRQRGFDHAKLISSKVARRKNLKHELLLGRNTNTRQFGSSRAQRIKQMNDEFYIKKGKDIEGRTILLVDDVMTSGASLSGAARTLRQAGAKRVYAVIFAQKI